MRKKKPVIPTLGFVPAKKPKAAGLGTLSVRGFAAVKPTPDQTPLITPSSTWVRPTELPQLHNVDRFALDTEGVDLGLQNEQGPGWAFNHGHVAGVGVSWYEGHDLRSVYAPIRHPDTDNFPVEQVAAWVTELTQKKRVVFFNAGYDIGWLNADLKVPVPPVIDDASCAAFMVDENREDLSLDGVCLWRGVPGKDMCKLYEAAQAYGYPASKAVANIGKLPARYAGEYGAQDPASTLLAMDSLLPEMARQGLMNAYATEMRLVPLMHAMRKRGIRIDVERAMRFQDAMFERAQLAFDALSERLGGMRVGIDEIRKNEWLMRTFDMEHAPYPKRGGKGTFDKDWMRMSTHWLPRLVAEAKQCTDMAEKFVGNYLLDSAHNGRIHASVNQWLYEEGQSGHSAGTRSHRLSYANPPLQQAPSRGERFEGWDLTLENAKEYRQCFLPEEGELWFSPDYSQQEYRHIVADAEMMNLEKAYEAAEMYRNDPKTDFHNIVVTLTGLPRGDAKNCNFAKSYGAGIPKFAGMIGKSVEEAGEIMGLYDKEMPFVKQLNSKCQKLADHRGWIKMFDGARAHFDLWEVAWLDKKERERAYYEGWKINACSVEEARDRQNTKGHPWFKERLKRAFTHKAMNRRIQGGGARQMKMAMATCWEEGIVPLLQMHDELSFSLTDPKIGERVVEIMRNVYVCSVPFLVDAEWGQSWGDASHGKHTFDVAARAAGLIPAAPEIRKIRKARNPQPS